MSSRPNPAVGAERPRRDALELLRHGRVEVLGRIPWGSNATLLADVYPADDGWDGADGDRADGDGADRDGAAGDDADREGARGDGHGPHDGHEPAEPVMRAVYKPRRGERPLWDFPDGLDRREVAAYELSRALGWDIVPETVLREDLPFGWGSLQRFVPFVADEHYFTLLDDATMHDALRTICCFDLVTNQADRKAGHCLVAEGDRRIWAVDNGLSFHRDLKLRTVIWDFAGDSVPEPLRRDLARLAEQGLPPALDELLDDTELAALSQRAERVAAMETFPEDPTGRRYPWPPI